MTARAILTELARSLTDFVFPPSCPGCGIRIDGESVICADCTRALDATASAHTPAPRTIPGIDRALVLLPYDELTRTLIHALKYHGISRLGMPLGQLMAARWQESHPSASSPVIIPVPLHPGKLRSRGYNQSERLSRGFAGETGLTIDESIIVRTRNTGTQTALDADARAGNVAGAFRLRKNVSVAGKHFIIIDDVLTTGSTVAACAQMLREGGAEGVEVCVVASPGVGED